MGTNMATAEISPDLIPVAGYSQLCQELNFASDHLDDIRDREALRKGVGILEVEAVRKAATEVLRKVTSKGIPGKEKHLYERRPTGISKINIHEGYPGITPYPGTGTWMCRGATTAENYRAARPSEREAARMVFAVARHRCSRRNATGHRDTDEHPCFDRTARRNHQRNAMAVCTETVDDRTIQ
jgi:hypothetical protein